MSTVAVIITCYNHGSYLRQSIESVISQTLMPNQIVVVDDGSTDITQEVAKQFSEVTYHYQSNRGISSARNRGLELIDTEFIIFLDADDILLPIAVRSGVEALLRNPNAAFCFGSYREIGTDGTKLPVRHADRNMVSYYDLLQWNLIGMHGAVTYRSASLRAINGFSETLRYCEDYDVYLRFARGHQIVATSAIVAEYRRSEDGLSSNFIAMMSSNVTVLESQKAFLSSQSGINIADGLTRARRFYGNKLAVQLLKSVRSLDFARAATIFSQALKHDRLFPLRIGRQAIKQLIILSGMKKFGV